MRQPLIAAAAGAPPTAAAAWWREAVVYQVYVRSFCDATGDGIGDLVGVRDSLPYLRDLGVDALWLNPFYPSPQLDHGYDVTDHCAVDPVYGTLADVDELVAAAHGLGLRVLLDLVPNHASIEHPLFRAAVAGGPGCAERGLFHFADGRGTDGAAPPNNWRSIFGGPVWQRVIEPSGAPGQWYLHLFTPYQPDWNWRHPATAERFAAVLRFWLSRGVDGFRIDAAGGLFKDPDLRDVDDPFADERAGEPQNPLAWGQPELHELYRSWRALCEAQERRDGRARVLVGEVSGVVADTRLRRLLAGDQLHQAFLFELLDAPWDPGAFRRIIGRELAASDAAAGSVAWVLGNHDRVRMATRFGGGAPGIGPGDPEVGLARARAAMLLLLALPGPVYVFQGDELGLPEVVDLEDHRITDPIFQRTNGVRRGRDGCRIPLPWRGAAAPFGFSPRGLEVASWLPQPASFVHHTIEQQRLVSSSTWHLCRRALEIRRLLRDDIAGRWAWGEDVDDVLVLHRGTRLTCAINMGSGPAAVPFDDEPALATAALDAGALAPDAAAWWIT